MLTEAPPIAVLTPTTAAPSSQTGSILTDEDLLDFLYDRKELRCLAASDAYFGDPPRYPRSETYMAGYRWRQQDMAARRIPIGTRTNQPMLCWGESYQLVADES
ncbi:MAG: hypothetical protein F6J95_023770 [Leptolyngbya sp. SIO1E4]|nr:hypothetical protein [Leptolyngbya sp. SIO1E4]